MAETAALSTSAPAAFSLALALWYSLSSSALHLAGHFRRPVDHVG